MYVHLTRFCLGSDDLRQVMTRDGQQVLNLVPNVVSVGLFPVVCISLYLLIYQRQ